MGKGFAEMSGAEVGWLLEGFGVNLLVRRVGEEVEFLRRVFGFEVLRADENYALLRHRGQFFQVHSDGTYGENPLLGVLPEAEAGLRGAGVELRLFEVKPEEAETRAREAGGTILQGTMDKPHGLRECFILDGEGYCWVPSVRVVRV